MVQDKVVNVQAPEWLGNAIPRFSDSQFIGKNMSPGRACRSGARDPVV